MTKIFYVLILGLSLVILFANPCQAIELPTPEAISEYLINNFKYELTVPDRLRPLSEILETMTGDCDDVAKVAKYYLSKIGIKSRIVIIVFKNLTIKHAVCTFRQHGYWNMFDNGKLTKTNILTEIRMLRYYYPDLESIYE
jgi:hypothetical protein